MKILSLLWSPATISLYLLADNEEQKLSSINIPSAIGSHRYNLALYKGKIITIRLPGDLRSPFMCSWDGGFTFKRLNSIPGDKILSSNGCRAHKNGILTAIDDQIIWIKPNELDIWLRYDIPDGFSVKDVSFDAQGIMHLVGSILSTRLPDAKTEAAYAFVEGGETSFVKLALKNKDIKLLEINGASEVFRNINAETEPIIVTSDCAWLFEDNSSFILLYSRDNWTVKRFTDKSIRSFIRHETNSLSFFTTEGYRYRTIDNGLTWDEQNLIPAISKVWNHASQIPLETPVIMAAIRNDNNITLAVSSYDWQSSSEDQLLGSAVLISYDDGQHFEVLKMVQGSKNEFLSLAFLL